MYIRKIAYFGAVAHIKDKGTITFDNDYIISVPREIILGNINLTIDGGKHRIILDGGDSSRIFQMEGANYSYPSVFIKNLTLRRGKADSGGGIYYNVFSSCRLEVHNCMFYKNSARYGGGIYVSTNSKIYNCVFIDNSASDSGGGAYSFGGSIFANCSFSNNYANQNAGGIITYESKLINCLVYGNHTTYNVTDIYDRYNSSYSYTASGNDISSKGDGNILLTTNPFMGTSLYDSLAPKAGSLLINAGKADTTGLFLPAYDFFGNPRIAGNRTDIGAYEYFNHKIESTTDSKGKILPERASLFTGENKKFSIIPNKGCRIDSLWIDGIYADSTLSYTFSNVQSNHIIKAKFAPDTFTIVSIVKGKGSITPNDTIVTYMDQVLIKITPEKGYKASMAKFGSVDILPQITGEDNYFEYLLKNVFSNDTIKVNFEPEVFNISTETKGTGLVTPVSKDITYFDTVKFTITPGTGHHILSAKYNETDVLKDLAKNDNNYTFMLNKILESGTLNIDFVPDTFSLSSAFTGMGTVSSNKQIYYGENLIFEITPQYDYTLKSVTCNGVDILVSLHLTGINIHIRLK
ncbi:MAG: hypothetical protein HC905_15120 [Bacteroidales bacterium]|nr:hypothetical protein [Bacteroidales bacterium]